MFQYYDDFLKLKFALDIGTWDLATTENDIDCYFYCLMYFLVSLPGSYHRAMVLRNIFACHVFL